MTATSFASSSRRPTTSVSPRARSASSIATSRTPRARFARGIARGRRGASRAPPRSVARSAANHCERGSRVAASHDRVTARVAGVVRTRVDARARDRSKWGYRSTARRRRARCTACLACAFFDASAAARRASSSFRSRPRQAAASKRSTSRRRDRASRPSSTPSPRTRTRRHPDRAERRDRPVELRRCSAQARSSAARRAPGRASASSSWRASSSRRRIRICRWGVGELRRERATSARPLRRGSRCVRNERLHGFRSRVWAFDPSLRRAHDDEPTRVGASLGSGQPNA